MDFLKPGKLGLLALSLIAATLLGAIAQLVVNLDVYQGTFGLYGYETYKTYWYAGGLVVCLVFAAAYSAGVRVMLDRRVGWASLTGLMTLSLYPEGYMLASAGLQAAAKHEAVLRGATIVLSGAVIMRAGGLRFLPAIAAVLLAAIIFAVTPRYLAVPTVPIVEIQQAALGPINTLVVLKGQLLLWLCLIGASRWALPKNRSDGAP